MTPEEQEQQQLQEELNQKLSEPHSRIIIFEDNSVYITNEINEVLIRDITPFQPPNPPSGGMISARWFNLSPT